MARPNIHICANAEELCSGYGIDSNFREEIVLEVTAEEAEKVLDELLGFGAYVLISESNFHDWNGGRFDQLFRRTRFLAIAPEIAGSTLLEAIEAADDAIIGALNDLKKTDDQADVEFAFDEAVGAWTGCTWTTQHGKTGIDLANLEPNLLREFAEKIDAGARLADLTVEKYVGPSRFEQMDYYPHDRLANDDPSVDAALAEGARRYRADLADDLRTGAAWLEEVAQNAKFAQSVAKQAVEAAKAGNWIEVGILAAQAASIEREYGDAPTWGPLEQTVDRIVDQ